MKATSAITTRPIGFANSARLRPICAAVMASTPARQPMYRPRASSIIASTLLSSSHSLTAA